MGPPRSRSRGWPTRAGASPTGRSSSVCPASRSDGHDFAPDAVERGAAALVCQRPLGLGVPEVVVDDVRAAMGPVAARFYGDPTSKLRVAGITGTNGKTTTAFLIRDVLEGAGVQTGLLGTVKQVVGGLEEAVERTTPEAIDLQDTFRRMLNAGDEACAMEVSSHALELGRADGIHFAVQGVHQPDPGPPGLPPDDGGLLPGQAAPVRPAGAGRGERRRRVRRAPGRRARRRHHLRGRGRRPTTAPRDVRFDVQGAAFTVDTPDGPVGMTTRLPGLFNVAERAGRVRGGARDGRGGGRGGARAGAGEPRARALRAGRGGPGLRRAGGLRAHARLAGERAAGRARADRGHAARGVRRGRRPRPGQAAADGQGGGRPRRPA